MVWYAQLGFKENPLDIRPHHDLVGLDYEEEILRDFIRKGELCFLTGLTGSGKSSMLKRIQHTLPSHQFVYLDAQDLPRGFNLERELRRKRSFFDRIRLRNFPSKTPVLLIDEFQDTDQRLVLEARAKWERSEDRRIQAIVIAQIERVLKNVTPAFKERLGNRVIELRTLDSDEMREMVRRRLKRGRRSFAGKIDEQAMRLLTACADGNPRRLLEYTEMLFDFHHNKFKENNPILLNPDYTINYYAAKEILALNSVNVAAYDEPERKVVRGTAAFNRRYTEPERKLLLYLMTGPKTYAEMARHLRVPEKEVRKRVHKLREKEAIVSAGRRGKHGVYEAAPKVKRLRVRV